LPPLSAGVGSDNSGRGRNEGAGIRINGEDDARRWARDDKNDDYELSSNVNHRPTTL
jgi:hypothetical protein